jgi:thiol-disulfide isomerase/thioredoxin
MTRFAARVCLFAFCAVCLWGCGSKPGQEGSSGAVVRDSATTQRIEVSKLDAPALARLIQERHGKVLFLNVWATWCVPCVEEFPDLVKLHHAFAGRPVEIVGVSADFDDEVESKIIPFLKKQNVPFRVYVASFQRQEDFINGVHTSWSGALPASLIIDSKGERKWFQVGKGAFDQFKLEIEKTLGGL